MRNQGVLGGGEGWIMHLCLPTFTGHALTEPDAKKRNASTNDCPSLSTIGFLPWTQRYRLVSTTQVQGAWMYAG